MNNETVDVFYQPLDEISSLIRNQLLRLNNRWNGRMHEHLMQFQDSGCHNDFKDATVFYIMSPDGLIASWAMVYKDKGWQGKWKTLVDFYTKKSERKKGYASCIARVIREIHPTKRMYGEHSCSTIFKRHQILRD